MVKRLKKLDKKASFRHRKYRITKSQQQTHECMQPQNESSHISPNIRSCKHWKIRKPYLNHIPKHDR